MKTLAATTALSLALAAGPALAQTFGASRVAWLDPHAGAGSALGCDSPLQGNACLVFTCTDCVNQPISNPGKKFNLPITQAMLDSSGFGQCEIKDLDVAVDLALASGRGAGLVKLELGYSLTQRELFDDSCASRTVSAVFDDEAPGAPDACPAVGQVVPKDPLSSLESYPLVGFWSMDVLLPNAKTAGTFGGWGLAVDVQCAVTPPVGCTANDTATCLNANRFRVSMTYRTPSNVTGPGHASQLTSDTGWFWFFDPANVEVVLKALNGCGVNDRYWVYVSGLTDVEVTITVTDTQTNRTKTYVNPLSHPFQPVFDVDAFPCP